MVIALSLQIFKEYCAGPGELSCFSSRTDLIKVKAGPFLMMISLLVLLIYFILTILDSWPEDHFQSCTLAFNRLRSPSFSSLLNRNRFPLGKGLLPYCILTCRNGVLLLFLKLSLLLAYFYWSMIWVYGIKLSDIVIAWSWRDLLLKLQMLFRSEQRATDCMKDDIVVCLVMCRTRALFLSVCSRLLPKDSVRWLILYAEVIGDVWPRIGFLWIFIDDLSRRDRKARFVLIKLACTSNIDLMRYAPGPGPGDELLLLDSLSCAKAYPRFLPPEMSFFYSLFCKVGSISRWELMILNIPASNIRLYIYYCFIEGPIAEQCRSIRSNKCGQIIFLLLKHLILEWL